MNKTGLVVTVGNCLFPVFETELKLSIGETDLLEGKAIVRAVYKYKPQIDIITRAIL